MACISCDTKNNLILYNTLYYCKTCYNNMLTLLNEYENKASENRKNNFEPPVKIFDNIYIGNINSVVDEQLKNLGITHIIIAGKKLKNKHHNNFQNLELLIDDSLEQEIITYINISNNFIDSFNDNKILIHCYSGISRSSTILIGYIMHKYKMNFDTAYNYLKNIYPKAHPNDNFKNQLRQLNSFNIIL